MLAADTPAAALRSNFRIDQDGLVESVGAIAERIHGPETAVADAARALRRAELERRPVVLMLPIDVQAQPAPSAAPRGAPASGAGAAAARGRPRTAVAAAADSSRPARARR